MKSGLTGSVTVIHGEQRGWFSKILDGQRGGFSKTRDEQRDGLRENRAGQA